jgi:hypothetical protein
MRNKTRSIKLRNGTLLNNYKTSTISKKEIESTYGLNNSTANIAENSFQKSRKSVQESIIPEEAASQDTMIRKSTIDYPRYRKDDNDYLKFVVEATPRKIYPVKDLY